MKDKHVKMSVFTIINSLVIRATDEKSAKLPRFQAIKCVIDHFLEVQIYAPDPDLLINKSYFFVTPLENKGILTFSFDATVTQTFK